MPGIVPELRHSRHRTRSAIASQFWESAEHSSRSIDGQVWELPCEPPALNLTGSSGLSRSQQLIAAQSLGAPAIPSFDSNSGGWILDRIFVKLGGNRWWTAIGGRAKAQKMYSAVATEASSFERPRYHRVAQALRNLQNYSLCARTRIQIARNTTFNAVLELPDVDFLEKDTQRSGLSQSMTTDLEEGTTERSGIFTESAIEGDTVDTGYRRLRRRKRMQDKLAVHAALRSSLPGHDLTASLGHNLDYVDSSGEYARVPLATSVDLSSHDRSDGLQYRVGLHQVSAPLTESESSHHHGRLRTVLHAQGAVAVEGEAYIWKRSTASGANTDSNKRGDDLNNSSGDVNGKNTSMVHPESPRPGEAVGAASRGRAVSNVETPSQAHMESSVPRQNGREETNNASKKGVGRVAEVVASAVAADSGTPKNKGGQGDSNTSGKESKENTKRIEGGKSTRNEEQKKQTDRHETVSRDDNRNDSIQDSATSQALASLENFVKPLDHVGEVIQHAVKPKENVAANDLNTAKQSPVSHESSTTGPHPILPVTAESISNAIAESLSMLKQIKENVNKMTGEVQGGSLQRFSDHLSRRSAHRRRPYSILLAQPHVKLNAAMGCLARMPLPPLTGLARLGSLSEVSENGTATYLGGGTVPNASSTGLLHRRDASTTSLASRASFSSQLAEAWEPYLKGTALRVFASAGISGQLGRFTRKYLDYTAASARIDLGLTSPHFLGMIPGASDVPSTLDVSSRPDKHRAFALEGRGSWHALSVSLAQQVFGPVRARTDFRFALDPTHVPRDQKERSTIMGITRTALSLRPSMLEAVYGADMILPGTEGAARLVVWWSPKRREAMAELRLF